MVHSAGYVWDTNPITRQEWEDARPAAWSVTQARPYAPSRLRYNMRKGGQRLGFSFAREAAASETAVYVRGDLDAAQEVTVQVRATLDRQCIGSCCTIPNAV